LQFKLPPHPHPYSANKTHATYSATTPYFSKLVYVRVNCDTSGDTIELLKNSPYSLAKNFSELQNNCLTTGETNKKLATIEIVAPVPRQLIKA
jgi:hypothetical protein